MVQKVKSRWGQHEARTLPKLHHLAHVIEHVSTASLDRRCIIGPYAPVTLGFLIEDYVVHLKHHLGKIEERVGA